MNVKAVLEERSPKYQQLVTNSAINGFDARGRTESYKDKIRKKEENDDVLEFQFKNKITINFH